MGMLLSCVKGDLAWSVTLCLQTRAANLFFPIGNLFVQTTGPNNECKRLLERKLRSDVHPISLRLNSALVSKLNAREPEDEEAWLREAAREAQGRGVLDGAEAGRSFVEH